MDNDTLMLISLLTAALCWRAVTKKQWQKDALDQLQRVEKVRRLTGKM